MEERSFQDSGFLLSKRPVGENYESLSCFFSQVGLFYCLKRVSLKKNKSPELDFFDLAEFDVEKAKSGNSWFLKSFVLHARQDALGKDYKKLQQAARFAKFLEKNLQHLETFEFAWTLTVNFLDALSTKPKPEATALKTYYLFARNEGFAVKEDWITRFPKKDQKEILHCIKSPLEEVKTENDQIEAWIINLFKYFEAETALIAPS